MNGPKNNKTNDQYKALYPRHGFDRLYVSKIEGGRGLASNEDSIDESIQTFEDCIEKQKKKTLSIKMYGSRVK